MNYRQTLMLRWSLFTAGLITIFWGVWSIFAPVPMVTEIKITMSYSFPLPFYLSRWLDILIGPIFACILITLFTNKKIPNESELFFSLGFSLVFGLVFGLAFSLGFSLVFSLVFSLGFGLVFSLVFSLRFGLGFSLGFGLVAGLGFGLGFSLGFGLVAGLGFSLGFGLVAGLGFGLGALINFLATGVLKNWLLAKDVKK